MNAPNLIAATLASHHSPNDSAAIVRRRLEDCGDLEALGRFLHRYIYWNGYFGCGVATLAGKIGRSRGLFVDPDEPFAPAADRSVLVASYFFDAARDEFDDRDTQQRDPHRCLAQATMKAMAQWANLDLDPRMGIFDVPVWLRALGDRVAEGYGAGSRDDAPAVFRAMGYHLGSEVLADREFSLIDEVLGKRFPHLVRHLQNTTVAVGDVSHNAYTWIRIHSGHGHAVEADHFEWATRGLNLALAYTPEDERESLHEQAILGYMDFVGDHREFFDHVNRD